jgi:hypothetical protein
MGRQEPYTALDRRHSQFRYLNGSPGAKIETWSITYVLKNRIVSEERCILRIMKRSKVKGTSQTGEQS